MSRLADYFCIAGVEDLSSLNNDPTQELRGDILQRFPDEDHKDMDFPQGLEHFCQPGGWLASKNNPTPTFYCSILTDIEGKTNYLACLTFYELHNVQKQVVMEDGVTAGEVETVTYYVPKSLCVVSRNKYISTLKNCMMTILASYVNDRIELVEKMISCMLGFIHVPPPGGPRLTFTIGGGDSQVLQPPLTKDLPATNEAVAVIFNQLGINSMLKVFTGLLTECKILLLASSYTHLTMASEALIALLYPLKYSFVFIPILPSSLIDFLTAPTPFLMGVHMYYKDLIPELFDVIVVNIDEGFVTIPDSVHLSSISEPYYTNMLRSLKMILIPSLFNADQLFTLPDSPQTLALQDKQLRAVFIKMFAEMFCGYRSCLTLIRVHPAPVISFNKMSFMEKRGLIGDEFFDKVLGSASFYQMTQGRGPPYRVIDMFDELITNVTPPDPEQCKSTHELLSELIPITDHLCQNEPWFDNPETSTIPTINSEMLNKSLKHFPLLNEIKIKNYLSQASQGVEGKAFKSPIVAPEQVPISTYDLPITHFINQRRLEVIKDCVQYIYDNKISDARKAMPSVLRALKSKGAQLALCNEFDIRVKSERSGLLNHDQYNLIVRLIDVMLKNTTQMYNTTVAAKVIPLVAAFHRKLGASAIQFAYTSVQEHAVWNSMQFWEETFYLDVQKQIVELHVKERLKKLENEKKEHSKSMESEDSSNSSINTATKSSENQSETNSQPIDKNARHSIAANDSTDGSLPLIPNLRSRTSTRSNKAEVVPSEITEFERMDNLMKELPNPMKLAADLLSEWESKGDEERDRLVYEEESIVFSILLLFAQHVMFLRVPTNSCELVEKETKMKEKQQGRLQMSNSQVDGGEFGSSTPTTDDNSSVSAKPANSVQVDGASTYMGGSIMEGSMGSMEVGYESVRDTTSKFILRFVERVCLDSGVTPAHLKILQKKIPEMVNMHIESLREVYNETKDAPTYKAKILTPTLVAGEVIQMEPLRCMLIPDGRELGVRDVNAQKAIEEVEEDHEMRMGADNGGPCLLPAEGALFLTNYRVIFKGTPLDQFASEMTVTRFFPVGALRKEKKISGYFTVDGHTYNSCLQMKSGTFQVMKLVFDEEVSSEIIENLRKTIASLRWPQSIYETFAFKSKVKAKTSRNMSQRKQNRANKTSLTSVASLKKMMNVDKRAPSTVVDNNEGNDEVLELKDALKEMNKQAQSGTDKWSESTVCKEYARLGLGTISKIPTSQWRLSLVNLNNYLACRSYPAVLSVPDNINDDIILRVAKNHRLNRFPVAVWKHKRTKGTLLRSGAINSKGILSAILRTGLGGLPSTGNLSSNVTEDEKFFTSIVNASHLYISKGKTQSVSIDAAPSVNAMNEDLYGEEATPVVEEEWKSAHLYIFTDKNLKPTTKADPNSKIVVVGIDMHDVSQVKTSYSKLLKVCCPNNNSMESRFFSAVEESKWLAQLSLLLQVSCSIVNLIDIQGSSCLVSFADGSEVTTQIVSLVQILSDPFYRTIEGFRVLVEKEWLAFGYRFTHRACHTSVSKQMGAVTSQTLAPFFLQFLDCVHQIMAQYPHAFEYNNYFLKFVAYHQTSARFNTFFLDSEYERLQHGWSDDPPTQSLAVDKMKLPAITQLSRQRKDAAVQKAEMLVKQKADQRRKKLASSSLWDYLKVQMDRFTAFNEFSHHPNLHKGILQPFCNISNLQVWDYYTAENLYTGAPYDLELISEFDIASNHDNQEHADVEREDSQRCVTGCYGSTREFPRDECSYLLYELNRLAEELDQTSQQWRQTWDSLDIKDLLRKHNRTQNWYSFWTKERRIALHKRATMDMVLKGKVSDNSQVRSDFGFEYPHQFQLKIYYKSSTCNYCLNPIPAGYNTGLQCTQCFDNTHEKCQSMVPPQCSKHPSFVEQPAAQMSHSSHSLPGNERTNPRNFKGTLYKKGRTLRNWKSRWFVFDAERNHLLYYNTEEDTQIKGKIDLGDMRTCRLTGTIPPGAPKWADARCCMEIITTRQEYAFLAHNAETAQEWIERLNTLNA